MTTSATSLPDTTKLYDGKEERILYGWENKRIYASCTYDGKTEAFSDFCMWCDAINRLTRHQASTSGGAVEDLKPKQTLDGAIKKVMS